jgi:hypothetical protein
MEIVEFLKRPERFTAVGARIPKGCLLVGPPGELCFPDGRLLYRSVLPVPPALIYRLYSWCWCGVCTAASLCSAAIWHCCGKVAVLFASMRVLLCFLLVAYSLPYSPSPLLHMILKNPRYG